MADDWYIGAVSCAISAGDTLSVHRPDKAGHIAISSPLMDETIYLTRDTVIDLMALLHTALTSENARDYR